jgi:hypothetical protein
MSSSILLSCMIFVFVGLGLLATTANGLSNTFQVYAADNCDAESICTNTGTGSDQQNNCVDSRCLNRGDHSVQNNRCVHAKIERSFGCSNIGDRSIQNNNCIATEFAECQNIGDGSTQNNWCKGERQVCLNSGHGSSQNNLCLDTICSNSGFNSNSNQNNNCVNRDQKVHRCINQGDSNQINNCLDASCDNGPNSPSDQSITCARITLLCSNFGNNANQNMVCANTDRCLVTRQGFEEPTGILTQNTICNITSCVADSRSGTANTQTTICNGAADAFCENYERDTTVLANGAPCKSGAPSTTTICQPGRTFTIPN